MDMTRQKTHPGPRIYTRLAEADQRVLYFADDPVVAGGKRGEYIFEHRHVPPGELPPHVFEEHVFLLPLGRESVRFHSLLNGQQVVGQLEPGRFRFLAAGDSLSTTWGKPMESILVALHPNLLHRALRDELDCASIELTSRLLPHDDPVLENLTLALQSYLQSEGLAGSLFEQSVLTAIAAHLVCAYGCSDKKRIGHSALLPRWKLARIEEYIRENLGRSDLSLSGIAEVAKLSTHQLSRTFKATTGKGLWRYVLECRAREAMRLMGHKNCPSLTYVAHACGFESYSQFIAAFRKLYGQLPSQHRRCRGS